MTHTYAFPWNKNHISPNQILVLFVLLFSNIMFAQTNTKNATRKTKDANESLINQYVESKGSNIITFDALNIKQFWIDNSVISKDNLFVILLNKTGDKTMESVPLKIQLANVNETQNCKVEVIAKENNFGFSILNNGLKVISTSSPEDNFLHYSVASSVFHLEATSGLSFFLKFNSQSVDKISVYKIILSFSDNKASSFLASPGFFNITGKDVTGGENKKMNEDNGSFSVSGKWFGVISQKKILISDKPVSNHVTIKNIGDKPTKVYLGYIPFTNLFQQINGRIFPYKNINHVLKVISSEENSNKIIVDSYPEWAKGCSVVLNAKEDLSDYPNFSFVGTISEIKELDDKRAEILLDKPIKAIKTGTKIRVHSAYGNTYLYTHSKVLNPGEEITFSASMQRDDTFFQYSPEAFCKGTYYVTPVILSYSINKEDINTILISDFTISF